MIKYIIIDDEHIAHEIIKGYCDMMSNMQLMKNCYDALEALDYLRSNKVDLIFLDLNMPKLKGFDFLKTLSVPPKVIVTTAYSEHALEGYELDIVDYLLKPFSFERFLKAVHKSNLPGDKQMTTVSELKTDSPTQIFLYTDKKHFQVVVNDILYIESSGNYVKVVTSDQTYTVREKLSEIIEKLPGGQFLQVHKSFVVSKQHIEVVEGNMIRIGKNMIPVGKMHRANIRELLG